MFLLPGLSTGWLRSGPRTNRSPSLGHAILKCDTTRVYLARESQRGFALIYWFTHENARDDA